MIRNPFTPAQNQALVSLRKGLPSRQIVLIGAAALACQLEMLWRRTNDLDLTVVAEPAELAVELRGIGWTRHERLEQRWTSPQGVLVDALPATAANLAAGKLVFAESGHVMNLTGFDLALTHCTTVPLDDDASLELATLPVIVVLKMAAWLDRPAERDRDLEDIAHVLDDYLEPDDLRRWGDDLINAGLPHEDQSAFSLGQDIGRIAGPAHHAIIDRFLTALSDETSSSNARLARCFGKADATDVVAGRLRAFRRGLQIKMLA